MIELWIILFAAGFGLITPWIWLGYFFYKLAVHNKMKKQYYAVVRNWAIAAVFLVTYILMPITVYKLYKEATLRKDKDMLAVAKTGRTIAIVMFSSLFVFAFLLFFFVAIVILYAKIQQT